MNSVEHMLIGILQKKKLRGIVSGTKFSNCFFIPGDSQSTLAYTSQRSPELK